MKSLAYSIYDTMRTAGKSFYYLFKTAEVIFKFNKYIIMGFTGYCIYKLVRNFIFIPMREIIRYVRFQLRPLDSIKLIYGDGKIIITGATQGLGPAYC